MIFFSDCTSPFEVSVVTDATQDAIASTIASSNKGKICFLHCVSQCLKAKNNKFLCFEISCHNLKKRRDSLTSPQFKL